jgi:hypothetical protein
MVIPPGNVWCPIVPDGRTSRTRLTATNSLDQAVFSAALECLEKPWRFKTPGGVCATVGSFDKSGSVERAGNLNLDDGTMEPLHRSFKFLPSTVLQG